IKDDPDCRFELGLLYSELAGAHLGQGRNVESQPLFYQGKAIYEQLVSEFPQDPTYREELAWALFMEANRVEQPDDAVKACRRALEINEQLAKEAPTAPAYHNGVAYCYHRMGIFLKRAGRRPEAEEAYRQAADLVERLLAEFPDWAPSDFGGAFTRTHRDLQWLLVNDGREKDAERIYLRALEIYPRLSKSWMKSPENRWKLAEYRWGLAKLASRYGRMEEATRFSAEALRMYEQVAAELPKNRAYQNRLAARKAEIGNFTTRAQPPKD
ncbi:MAG: tetratricopeptide repeat protein, partial [Gammaproteobacteria bacterium]